MEMSAHRRCLIDASGVADCYMSTQSAVIGISVHLARLPTDMFSSRTALPFGSTTLQAPRDQTSSILTWTLLPPQPAGSTLHFSSFNNGICNSTPG